VADSDGRGAWAEALACTDLETRGLRLVERNFRMKCGELDLIMRHAGRLVFVEVRYRSSERWGGGLASVTPEKQRRLTRAANGFLARHPELRHLPCRFDVVAVGGTPESPTLRWVQGAFERR
jgi:putative endonuclease